MISLAFKTLTCLENLSAMSLYEFARQQQEWMDKIYPPQLKALYETLSAYQKIKPVLDFKPVFLDPIAKDYISAFSKIDAIAKLTPNELKVAFDTKNFGYVDHDLNLPGEDEPGCTIQLDETKKLQRIITDIYTDSSQLYKLQPREFEELIAELLLKQGYKVELTKQTRDNGYDILAVLHLGYGHAPMKFLVECKKYSEHNKVGVEIVRSFKEVIDTEKANRGILVTTSYFTKDAVKKQKQTPYLLDYRDKDEVMKWVYDYYTETMK